VTAPQPLVFHLFLVLALLCSQLCISPKLCVFFFWSPSWEHHYRLILCFYMHFPRLLSLFPFLFPIKKKRNFCLYLYAYVFFSGNEDVWSLMLSCYFHVVIHNLLFILRWELPRSFFTPWWPWEDVFPLSRTW
jgi:hypothetical protein